MKKYGSILVAAALLLTMGLTACAPRPKLNPNSPITIEIWHYYNGPQKTAFDNMVTQFNDTIGLKEGIIVEAFSQGNVNALAEKLHQSANQMVGSDPMPDLFASYADTAYELDKLGVVANLDQYFTKNELAAYRPEFIAEGRISADGSLKIFPVAKSVELMMINLTTWNDFAAATGAQLSDLDTFEGITRTAEAYYSWSDGKAFYGRDAMANYMHIGSRQLGTQLFQITDSGVTVQADKATLRRLWDNYYVPFISGWFSSNGRFRSDEATLGDIIALVGSSSATSYFPSQVAVSDLESYPIDCLIRPAPIFEGGESYAIQQGAGMAVTKSDLTREYASALFLKWFTDTQQNVTFSAASGGYLPVKNDALNLERIDTALAALGPDAGDLDRMHQTFAAALEELNRSTLYTPPPFEGNTTARSILEKTLNDKAKADREAILSLVSGGTVLTEAVAQYDNDANFDAWYETLTADLTQAIS